MNCWSFAIQHPIAACILGVSVCASVAITACVFAENKTPIIGSLSPSFSMNVGTEVLPQTTTEVSVKDGKGQSEKIQPKTAE